MSDDEVTALLTLEWSKRFPDLFSAITNPDAIPCVHNRCIEHLRRWHRRAAKAWRQTPFDYTGEAANVTG